MHSCDEFTIFKDIYFAITIFAGTYACDGFTISVIDTYCAITIWHKSNSYRGFTSFVNDKHSPTSFNTPNYNHR
jgi:hypothetical protein